MIKHLRKWLHSHDRLYYLYCFFRRFNQRQYFKVIKKFIESGDIFDKDVNFNENDSIIQSEAYPQGHYYSAIPDLSEIKNDWQRVFHNNESLHEIDLNTNEQLLLLSQFRGYYSEQPFPENKQSNSNIRYFFNNDEFSYMDALVLYCMIRYFSPKRIIEIGCGFSSLVMLDTNSIFFDNKINLTFIEPYPERLLTNILPTDDINLIQSKVQHVDVGVFEELERGDILFIDGSHVSKVGSDVHFLLFEVIPRLPDGVIIHFHDIFYPFEYPSNWIFEGRFWNELYLLRAYLMFTNSIKIKFFNSYLSAKYTSEISEYMPMGLKNSGGSIWLEIDRSL